MAFGLLLTKGEIGNKRCGYFCPTCKKHYHTEEKLRKHWRKGHKNAEPSEAQAPKKKKPKKRNHIFNGAIPKKGEHISDPFP